MTLGAGDAGFATAVLGAGDTFEGVATLAASASSDEPALGVAVLAGFGALAGVMAAGGTEAFTGANGAVTPERGGTAVDVGPLDAVEVAGLDVAGAVAGFSGDAAGVVPAGFAVAPPGIGSGFESDGVLGVAAGAAGFAGAAADGVVESESKRNIDVAFALGPADPLDGLVAGDVLDDGDVVSPVLKIGCAGCFPVVPAVAVVADGFVGVLDEGAVPLVPVSKIGAGAAFADAAGPSPGDVLLDPVEVAPVLKMGAGIGFAPDEGPRPGDVLLDPAAAFGCEGDDVLFGAALVLGLAADCGSAVFAASSGDFGSVIACES